VNKITTLGIDLAKTVFQLHGLDCASKVVLCREVRRTQLMRAIAQLEPCEKTKTDLAVNLFGRIQTSKSRRFEPRLGFLTRFDHFAKVLRVFTQSRPI
jgi:hypothetical protein